MQHSVGNQRCRPNTFNEIKRATIKVPQTIIVVGINSKDLDTKSGTFSGIFIVIFFLLQKLYNSTEPSPAIIPVNSPLAPKFPISKAPSGVNEQ